MAKVEDYEKDINRLSAKGLILYYAIFIQHGDENHKKAIPTGLKDKLPSFTTDYQPWYSECVSLLSQILPERLEDFKAYYAPKTARKEIGFANYTVSDALRGLVGTQYGEVKFAPISAATAMYQQYTIVDGLKNRFKSTLYDIKTLVHADLLDDELHAAQELNKNSFQRGSGAIAGVVLEGHLAAVCERHQISLRKKDPAISDLNDALKSASVIDIAQWRFIQHLGDIRNKCDHKKSTEPTKEEVAELIEGVRKTTKTVL
ncbi:hypothetical protein ELI30_00940 [Rhizobium leguminosarum]|uniref:hypothetical protein n=1 Tax=Rhizobium leguminosarum TaxID=384 RepID=UPI00102FDCE3|nr:hypothetical protein [Rhizobium leguminosarum]TAV46902.1 hypothetical protein ELI32_00940 [Rhizobium leguminosarum]TAV56482.1 hypothetical protein ELI31_00940 [Rhizobium leguminosarum]TAV67418.1 hypothetical protein ELI30_00940 [Rhizobium leguminosarum]